jgi:hypothetical protein
MASVLARARQRMIFNGALPLQVLSMPATLETPA